MPQEQSSINVNNNNNKYNPYSQELNNFQKSYSLLLKEALKQTSFTKSHYTEFQPKEVQPLDIEQLISNKKRLKKQKSKAVAIDDESKQSFKQEQKKEKYARINVWNINGISSVLRKNCLQNYIEKEQPSVLFLNQIRVCQSSFHTQTIWHKIPPQYHQYWNFCTTKKGYAGTALLTKTKPKAVYFGIGIEKHDEQGRSITAEFQDFIAVTAYVPYAGEYLKRIKYRTQQWDRDFRAYIKWLQQSKKKPIILCGDLNVAHQAIDAPICNVNQTAAGFTTQERVEFQYFLDMGYLDSFRLLHPDEIKYSAWDSRYGGKQNNKGWRLDYFIVSKSLKRSLIQSNIQTEYQGSDHSPLYLKFDRAKIKLSQ